MEAQIIRDQWFGVELRHLAALSAVAREGSFRGAADSLGYVQSAVSQQIAYLERHVGVQLIDRRSRPSPVSLTEAGDALLAHVKEILARLQAAQADLAALGHGTAGRVRIGVYQTVATRLIPSVLPAFTRSWPAVEVAATEAATDAGLFDLVQCGELDLAFAGLPLADGPFDHAELIDDPYVLLVPADDLLARRGTPPTAGQLRNLRLIGALAGREAVGVGAQLRLRGVEPEFVYRSDNDATVQSLVGARVGAAIVPRLSVDVNDPRTAALAMDHLLAPRKIALFWHRERMLSAAVRGFRETAIALSRELGQPEDEQRAPPAAWARSR